MKMSEFIYIGLFSRETCPIVIDPHDSIDGVGADTEH